MSARLKYGLLLLGLSFALGCNALHGLATPGAGEVTGATTGARPLIVRAVEFPAVVESQGAAADGWVYLYCEGCNAPEDWEEFERAEFGVLEAQDFTGFAFDPRPWIENVGENEVRFNFNIRCGTPQQVRLQVTVINTLGEQSNPYEFDFTCE